MRALVTGGGGFIGSSLVRALLEQGHSVRTLDSFLTGSPEPIPAGAELVEGDRREAGIVEKACADIDVVFHKCALRSVPKSVDQPLLATECNVLGTLNVLLGAHSQSVRRVVYASSS